VSTGGVFGGAPGRAQRQRLGRALRAARAHAGLTTTELAARLGIGQSSVSRYETGAAVPPAALLDAWASAGGIHPSNRPALAELHEQAAAEAVSWRAAHRTATPAQVQAEVAAMERDAKAVRAFEPILVPGILQTPAYAAAVYRARGLAGDQLAAATQARVDRQAYLFTPGLDLHLVVGEAALRWRLTRPELHLAQLDRIGQLAGVDGLRLALLPFGAELAAWHGHGFVLFDLADGPVAHVETLHAAVNVLDPDETAGYEQAFERLAAAAVTGASAQALLRRLAAELRV
jgi:transcriptional regulator with XRE-family HTH domain